MVLDTLVFILTIGAVLLIGAAFLSPFESLGWLAGWSKDDEKQITNPKKKKQPKLLKATHVVIYLSGIGLLSGDRLMKDEEVFFHDLRATLPNTIFITDIFPYAMNNNGLNGQHMFSRFWRWLDHHYTIRPMYKEPILYALVNVRNLFQVAVSADNRYGPIYNLGTAQVIIKKLVEHGYDLRSDVPVTIVGYSGGAQIALGASSYVTKVLRAPLTIISLGGVMSESKGLEKLAHLYHLHGTKDGIDKLGSLLFPSRWSISVNSFWNRARAEGKITYRDLGPIGHNGKTGYLSTQSSLPDGRSFYSCTRNTIIALLKSTQMKYKNL
jgi:hypothetical protein